MAMSKFDLRAWEQDESAFAAKVPARLLRGLLTRTLTVPAGTTALLLAEDGSRRPAPAGEVVGLDGVARVVFVRTAPLELGFELGGLVSDDRLLLDAVLRLTVQACRHEIDLLAIADKLLQRDDTADHAALRRALEPAVADAARTFFAARPMAEIVAAPLREQMEPAVREAVGKPAFEAGIEFVGLEQVVIESAGWREKLAAEQRSQKAIADLKLAEEIEARRHDGQVAKVERLEKLAARLNGLRSQFPGLSLENLIGRAEDEHRGELYDALLGLYPDAQPCRRLYVAAGRCVLTFDPPDFAAPAETLYAPPELGSVRSVQVLAAGEGIFDLAVGCQFGVWFLPGDGTAARTYPLPAGARRKQLKGGINSVARAGGLLFGAHSEVGLTVWRPDAPDREGRPVRPGLPTAAAVRGAAVDDQGRLLVTWDRLLLRLDPARLAPSVRDPDRDGSDEPVDAAAALEVFDGSEAEITCLLPLEGHLLAGNAAGQLLRWDPAAPGPAALLDRTNHKVYSLGYALLGNVRRLLIGDNEFCVRARVLGDHKESRYKLGQNPVCFVAGSSDHIFAIDAGQSHVYVWKATDPEKPAADIPVRRLTQHSAKDLAVLTGLPRDLGTDPPDAAPAAADEPDPAATAS